MIARARRANAGQFDLKRATRIFIISTRCSRVLTTPKLFEFNQIELKELLMKLRPLHDRVIVKRLDNERKTASGIVIPENAAEKPDQGEIMAVGNGKVGDDGKVRAMAVKTGDRILFGKYSGQTVKVDGDELLVLREEDIMAVIEK
jgi:chaperonin GroES